jgi:NADH-quinone oxidoreductase subunit N
VTPQIPNSLVGHDLWGILPELILIGTGITVLLWGAVARNGRRGTLLGLSLAGLLAVAVSAVRLWNWNRSQLLLKSMVTSDRLGVVAVVTICAVTAVGLIYGYDYFRRREPAEFYSLMLFAASGMALLAVSADLIMVFLSIEILSLALYVLCGFSFRIRAGEASMKYFLLGAFSSAFFLYGVAFAYGSTGTTSISGIANAISGQTKLTPLLLVAIGLLAVGFAFKVAAVPFHMWTPDVYQGAPTSVTSFMAAGTKVAAFVALVRVFNVALQPMQWNWQPVIAVLAIASAIVGSVLAVAQNDVKRMLAYSSIANAGFILVGVAAGGGGIAAVLFYLIAYSVMVLGAFGIVIAVSNGDREESSLDRFRGLAHRSPMLAGLMALFLLSMAGIPPTAGFLAKVAVFGSAVTAGGWGLALVALLSAVVAAFVYIRVVVLMYMREPEGSIELETPALTVYTGIGVFVPAAVTLLLGIFPGVIEGVLKSASVLRW